MPSAPALWTRWRSVSDRPDSSQTESGVLIERTSGSETRIFRWGMQSCGPRVLVGRPPPGGPAGGAHVTLGCRYRASMASEISGWCVAWMPRPRVLGSARLGRVPKGRISLSPAEPHRHRGARRGQQRAMVATNREAGHGAPGKRGLVRGMVSRPRPPMDQHHWGLPVSASALTDRPELFPAASQNGQDRRLDIDLSNDQKV